MAPRVNQYCSNFWIGNEMHMTLNLTLKERYVMNRRKLLLMVALVFTVFLVLNTPNVNAYDIDPGGSSGYVYADITVKFEKFRCLSDTDVTSGSGLAFGGADVWLRASGTDFSTVDRKPVLNDEFDGIPNNSGILIGPFTSREHALNGWGSYFSVTYSNVYLNSDKILNLYVYDQDLLGFKQELIECKLIIKAIGSVASPRFYNDIFAEYANDYVDSYINFGRVDGAYYSTLVQTPWGSYTWTMNNGLYIDVSITYHN